MRVGSNTRVIIKNLPLSLGETQVQGIVSQKCKEIGLEFTDCKLLTKAAKNTKGKTLVGKEPETSRGLCFVGFADEKDATKFKDFYNGTYFRACKVTVEYSRPPPKVLNDNGDATGSTQDKPERVLKRSKHELSNGEVATTLVKKVGKYTKAGVAGERKHTVFEDEGDSDTPVEPKEEDIHIPMDSDPDVDTDEVDPEILDRVILFNLPYNVTEAAIRELCRPFGPITDVHIPMNSPDDKDTNSDKLTKGFCYVTWVFPSDAVKFRDAKNRSIFCGRIIHVDIAKPKLNINSRGGNTYDVLTRRLAHRNAEKSSYKRELQKKKMAEAGNANIWNTLHIDINATVSAVSRELELEKKEVMDENYAAVNVALTETLVLNELTKWLDQQGIDYQQFQIKQVTSGDQSDVDGQSGDSNSTELDEHGMHKVHRSDDTIIIKNLPREAADTDLVEMFSKYGQLMRLAISPYNVMGIVQFLEPKAASIAFKNLAYKPYGGLPMYLEWAPVKLFHEGAPVPALPTRKAESGYPDGTGKITEKAASVEKATNDANVDEPEDIELVPTNVSIYIKNLHFRTRNDALKNHFGTCKGYVTSKVVMKDNDTLSRGFGFVEFDSLANAKAAIRAKTGLLIDGKVIEMSIAKRMDKPVAEIAENKLMKATTKIIVKNLAFQATKQDLHKMFSFYGNVKSIRIPKSLKSNNRGFAFVEFFSKQESARAVESLQHTHLYGRHLVLEFAEETDDDNITKE
ncbi:RNA recognition motif domain containing protein [Babesia ovis]|uniref:RNA recognition motif domain containing protein n=1 Tax=Babesia ovis TaxID=5869 RepID=A0A9W5TBM2_BABOV|nr:RNA recognition motif domain containing protein [Babesia ovis]